MRGGLGNQLHQLCAASYFVSKNNWLLLIYDYDLTQNDRDGYVPRYLNFPISKWFARSSDDVFVARGLLQMLIRIVLSIQRRFAYPRIVSEAELKEANLPRFFFLRDYFMDKKYIEAIRPHKIVEVLEAASISSSEHIVQSVSCNVHVRLRDYYLVDKEPLDSNYYRASLALLNLNSQDSIHVFSDDIEGAREILPKSSTHSFVFPEEIEGFSQEQLLFQLSCARNIIASRSSLCWWSCVLATLKNPAVRVICSWPDNLILQGWIKI
jgi:hypothetical protein